MKTLTILAWISAALTILGGLNWALVGLIDMDLIRKIFGNMTIIARFFYILIGIAIIYFAFFILL